ncbi:lytic polysaccharide monooxygenase auxiliary activity family 9 protein [Streptomyces profundus]|uniref:lytic polysaccharide monooxygenase auxiliary activity family 9 protein n=1 Tax=Streptomyces profundus TaxID=2867410 RepID=UPI001D15EBE7|nr:lytic polysaccharide monooxygenase [Streptomyces sp. MA3_2.13]UED87460.1 lytic polysaccharide monooxygenase [Streptomyces sp. MA3_2.13]
MYADTPTRRWTLRVITPVLAAIIGLIALFLSPWSDTAKAHGSIVDPAGRAYGCWDRWGSDHMNPAMEQEDPMCWQAFQANPNTMWNWMSLYRENLAGNWAAIPDGKLCSAGDAQSGLATSLDNPGPWTPTNVGSDFSVHLYDTASHGADFFEVYVTKQGYDPTTQALGWGDLELVETTGAYPPASDITFDVSAPGRSGHHIVYTIWQASHLDQTYFICSDVNFS